MRAEEDAIGLLDKIAELRAEEDAIGLLDKTAKLRADEDAIGLLNHTTVSSRSNGSPATNDINQLHKDLLLL